MVSKGYISKNVLSLKTTILSCLYFVNKTYILTKTVLSCSFFHIFHEKRPRCHAYIWSKNVKSVKTIIYSMGQKITKKLYFSHIFKKFYPHTNILSKNHPFSKNPALMPIFCQKTSTLSKTQLFHFIFENIQ